MQNRFQYLKEQPHSHRFDKLCHNFFEIAKIGLESDDNCELLMDVLDESKYKIVTLRLAFRSNMPRDSPSELLCHFDESIVTNPKTVGNKGSFRCRR